MDADFNSSGNGSNQFDNAVERFPFHRRIADRQNDPNSGNPGESNLPRNLEGPIKQLALTPGNQEPQVAALAAATEESRWQGEREYVVARRKSLAVSRQHEREWRADAAQRLRGEEPTVVVGRELTSACLIRYGMLLFLLAFALYIDNTSAATIMLNLSVLGVQTMWEARKICLATLAVAVALILGVKLLSTRSRRRINAAAVAVLLASFVAWVCGFGVQVARYAEVADLDMSDLLQRSFTEPAAEWPAIAMFLGALVMSAAATFVGHAAIEYIHDNSGERRKNPRFEEAVECMRRADERIAALDGEIASLDKTLATLRSERSRLVTTATIYYRFLRGGSGALVLALMSALFATGCASHADPTEESRPPVHLAVAISPELDTAATVVVRKEILRLADWTLEAAAGSTVVFLDGQRGSVISRLVAVDGVPRIRKQALLEPMGYVLRFLETGLDDGSLRRGRVNMPRLSAAIGQMNGGFNRVCVLGSPLFDSELEVDKPFNMTADSVPSDSQLYSDASPFSILGREQALRDQDWFLGWEVDGSLFSGALHERVVRRFWSIYLGGQGARLVFAGSSSGDALQSMLRTESSRPLFMDEPDRDAPLEMVQINADSAVTHLESTVDAVDRPTQVAAGNAPPEISSQSSAARRNLLILAFNHDSDIQTSPIPRTLRNAGFNVGTLSDPLPPIGQFSSILERTHEVLVIASARTDLLPDSHLQSLVARWRTGKLGLLLFSDNAPYLQESQAILAEICPGVRFEGSDVGGKTLGPQRGTGSVGFDQDSPLFEGVTDLWEGSTISAIRVSERAGLPQPQTICWSSAGKPLIATIESGSSRCIVHCGYTALYSRFISLGMKRFVLNAARALDPTNADVAGPSNRAFAWRVD